MLESINIHVARSSITPSSGPGLTCQAKKKPASRLFLIVPQNCLQIYGKRLKILINPEVACDLFISRTISSFNRFGELEF